MLRFNSHNRHNKFPFTHKRISYILIYYLFQCYKMTMLKYPVNIFLSLFQFTTFSFLLNFSYFIWLLCKHFVYAYSVCKTIYFVFSGPTNNFFSVFLIPLPPPPPSRKIIVRPSLSLKPVFQCFVSEWKRHFELNRHDFLVLYFCVPDLS